MPKSKKQPDPIPETFANIEAAAEFWDNHSTADYDELMRDAHFDVDIQRQIFLVPVEGQLAKEITAIADQDGLALETVVNLWLQEKLHQVISGQQLST